MKKISLAILTTATVFADTSFQETQAQSSTRDQIIELSYTFSKVSRIPINQFNLQNPVTNKTETKYDTFDWGNQATASYEKVLKNSYYSFLANFTFLHAGNTYSLQSPDQNSPYVFGESQGVGNPGFTYHRMQLNYYEADFFVKNTLSKAKHAIFDVFGGLISSWYKYKFYKNYNLNPALQIRSFVTSTFTNTNYFMGPNLKIQIKAPFYKEYFVASIKAGLGMMLNFKSTQQHNYSLTIAGPTTTTTNTSDKLKNDYQFCPQADLEAYLGFKYKGFNLDAGVNQFFLIQNLLTNRAGSLTFGGPFIRAGYGF